MSNKAKNIIIIILTLGTLFLLSYIFILKNNLDGPEVTYITQRDTLIINHIDTVKIEKIKYKERKVLDTIFVKDTALFKELKVYCDSLSEIYISGVNPNIDSIFHFINKDTIYINTESEKIIKYKEKPKKFHLSAQLGIGALYGLINKQFDVGPYIGVGISYDIW